jgi:hypothetical protein|tara:strand:+ start:704 stop:1183 length:480 start_codon:yes stop_codon:yes gene_type:complete
MSLLENTKYQYIRFKDGKDCFAMVSDEGETLTLIQPMNVLCKQSTGGIGVTLHLGPMIPFTNDNSVTINLSDVSYRTSITDEYIGFYDEACTAWLNQQENGGITIKTQREEYEENSKTIKELIDMRLNREEFNYNSDMEIEEEEYLENMHLPSEKDIIH